MMLFATIPETAALMVGGIDIPNARVSRISRAFEKPLFPPAWPYDERDLTPIDSSNDQIFYTLPKFVHHACEECRASLADYYSCVLPTSKDGSVLDLCSSWTSHYPKGWKPGKRMVAVGLNPLELIANPSKTEWRVQNLNTTPKLPFSDNEFDVITNSLSVDYMTQPLELFAEMHRVLKPGGTAAMAFTNRCFPQKIVPIWADPFTDFNHAKIVGNYFHFSSSGWEDISAVDVSPPGPLGEQDPMIVVQARKSISSS